MSFHVVNIQPNSCPECGGKQWVNKGYFSVPYSAKAGNFFEDARCLNPQCRHHFVEYGKEQNVFKNTPEEFKKFIEDNSLENELETASVGGMN